MPADPLSAFEREGIRAGILSGDGDGVIAAGLGRHRCTVNAEINRNGGRQKYSAVAAQARADQKRCRPKVPKLVADRVLAAEVTRRLKARDSPMRISIELTAQGSAVSHECIYQAIHHPHRGLEAGLWQRLHLKRRRRRPRHGYRPPGSHSLGEFSLIHARPAIASQRCEVGHLEGDLIVGAMNRSAMITLFDRASRHVWLATVASKTADATHDELIRTLKRIPPPLRRTLTWDQGAEMARHTEIAHKTGIDIYFADPKSPWQRPTNENGNAIVRRYVGKSTNLNQFKPRHLRHIEHRINTIPRRSLGWATAHDTYTQAVAMTE